MRGGHRPKRKCLQKAMPSNNKSSIDCVTVGLVQKTAAIFLVNKQFNISFSRLASIQQTIFLNFKHLFRY